MALKIKSIKLNGGFYLKLNKIILVGIILLAVISLGAANAQDNSTSNIGGDESSADLTQNFEDNENMLTNVDDKLSASSEEVVGNITVDNVTVDVSDVFNGCETTIFVTAPEATGSVNITVGEKTYAPEFVGGVATQIISKYDVGINNVTVQYNDIVKETSFKVLDGVITNETFDYYFEIIGKYFYLRSFIPDGVTLDFRGYIYHLDLRQAGILYGIRITKSCNMTSTTGDAVIGESIIIQSGANGSNISNIKAGFRIEAFNCNIFNLTDSSIYCLCANYIITDSTLNSLSLGANSIVTNCIINRMYMSYGDEGINNVSIFNSTFNNGIYMQASYMWRNPFSNFTIVNCNISGETDLWIIKDSLIENCSFNEGYMHLYAENLTLKNNFINVPSSTYAIRLLECKYCKFINNRIYSKDYCGDNAIVWTGGFDINFMPERMNVFKNNTPKQTNLDISLTSNAIFYDENMAVVVNMPGIGGKVVFYFNNEKMSVVELVNGTATQTIDKYHLGINNVTVTYEDLVNDIYAINHTSVAVNKVNYCPVNLVYDNITEGKTSIVNVILPEDANGTIILKVYNNHHSISVKQDANGSCNIIKMPPLLEGNYTIYAVFTSVKYVTNSSSENIGIVHTPVYKLTASNVVMDYKDGSKYKVLVIKDGKAVDIGEVVKITFNGVTKNVKTDKNGYATLALDSAPKTYTIKATCNGVTKSTKVTIKNILKASNISKKKAKKIKFSATLKTSKGKAISGKKITFKFKGKTYTEKTNKKGVATITLKNLKVGKYAITSKYGACTVKNTIKIKK